MCAVACNHRDTSPRNCTAKKREDPSSTSGECAIPAWDAHVSVLPRIRAIVALASKRSHWCVWDGIQCAALEAHHILIRWKHGLGATIHAKHFCLHTCIQRRIAFI